MRISQTTSPARSDPRRPPMEAANDPSCAGLITHRVRCRNSNIVRTVLGGALRRAWTPRQLGFAVLLSIVLVVLGFADVTIVDQSLSSSNAAGMVTPLNRTGSAALAAHANVVSSSSHQSWLGDPQIAGVDRTDHSRECLPDRGVDSACIFN